MDVDGKIFVLARGALRLLRTRTAMFAASDVGMGSIPHVQTDKGAGFENVETTNSYSTLLGRLSLYRARKPFTRLVGTSLPRANDR